MDAGGRATQDAVAEDAGCDPCHTGASTPQIREPIIARALRSLCLLFFSFGLSMQAGAVEKDVRSWLQEMVDSTHSLNYEGIFVYLHDNQLESMQVVHTVDDDGERERLFSLNGAAREVVRDNASVTCVAPDARSVSISRRAVGTGFRSVFGMDLNALSNYYRFNLLDSSRVAGRDTQLVAISPVDDYRYGYRIYLDRQNALPLKTELLNANAEAVSQIMFTSIKVKLGGEKLSLADDSMEGREHYAWEQRKPMQSSRGMSSWYLLEEDSSPLTSEIARSTPPGDRGLASDQAPYDASNCRWSLRFPNADDRHCERIRSAPPRVERQRGTLASRNKPWLSRRHACLLSIAPDNGPPTDSYCMSPRPSSRTCGPTRRCIVIALVYGSRDKKLLLDRTRSR